MTDEVINLARERNLQTPEDDLSRPEQLDAYARELLSALQTRYRVLVDDEGQSSLAEIRSPGVIQPVKPKVVIERDVVRMFSDRVTVRDLTYEVFPRLVSEMRAKPGLSLGFKGVKPFHFKSDSLAAGWAWQRLPFDPIENPPKPPELTEIMRRTSAAEAEAVEIWIGSLFDYAASRTQYLYIHGEGNDGKSMLKDAVSLMFANQGIAIMDGDDLTGDKHATSDLEGKRLLLFPDMRKPSLPSTGVFKKITGDDSIGVNPKGLPRRNIALHVKVMILSNYPPQLEGTLADKRRLVSAKFESFAGGEDEEFKRQFLTATPAIAQYCYAKYLVWRQTNAGKLPQAQCALDEAMGDSIAARAADLASTLFRVGPDTSAAAHEVDIILKRAAGSEYPMLAALRQWIKNQPGVVKTSNAPRKYKGLERLPTTNRLLSAFED